MCEAFAMQKLITFFFQQNIGYYHLKFNEMLTNVVVSFDKPGPVVEGQIRKS